MAAPSVGLSTVDGGSRAEGRNRGVSGALPEAGTHSTSVRFCLDGLTGSRPGQRELAGVRERLPFFRQVLLSGQGLAFAVGVARALELCLVLLWCRILGH